jgi:hypothetical protein
MERRDSTAAGGGAAGAGKRNNRVVSWLDEGDSGPRDDASARLGRHAADPPFTPAPSAWTFVGDSGGRRGRHAAEADPAPTPPFPPLAMDPVRPAGDNPAPQWWDPAPVPAGRDQPWTPRARATVSVVRIVLTVVVLAAIVLLALVVAAQL